MINTNDIQLAKKQIDKMGWKEGKQYHVVLQDKETIKAFLGMKVLPHAVLVECIIIRMLNIDNDVSFCLVE